VTARIGADDLELFRGQGLPQVLAAVMIARGLERGWMVEPSPQLAFWHSPAEQRLYMRPAIDGARYASRWEGADLRRVGRHSREDVERTLWPWLKLRGYAADGDDPVLCEFLEPFSHPVDQRPWNPTG
jgi:hypothetical protein